MQYFNAARQAVFNTVANTSPVLMFTNGAGLTDTSHIYRAPYVGFDDFDKDTHTAEKVIFLASLAVPVVAPEAVVTAGASAADAELADAFTLSMENVAADRPAVGAADLVNADNSAGDAFLEYGARVTERPGWFTAVSHTNGGNAAPTVFRALQDGAYVDMQVPEFADQMVGQGYVIGSGQPVRLLACAAGEGDDLSLAQQLATHLGATVEASPFMVEINSAATVRTFARDTLRYVTERNWSPFGP